MKVVQKRMIAAGCIGVLLIGGAVVVAKHGTYEQNEKNAASETETASVSRVVKQPADLTFWYSDESYQEFFEKAAEVSRLQKGHPGDFTDGDGTVLIPGRIGQYRVQTA